MECGRITGAYDEDKGMYEICSAATVYNTDS